jgi:glucokinase
VDPADGIARMAVNLGWRDVPLRSALAERLGDLPLWVHNDAKAGALGELYFGAARGCSDFVYLAVGTGLGAGAVIAGEVLIGANAFAMELGHLGLDPNGRLCACGLRGCPETFISGNGLLLGVAAHRASYPDSPLARAQSPTTEAVLEAARAGDPLARTVMDEARHWLLWTMQYCVGTLNPGLFVIGGGLGHAAHDLLLDGIEAALQARTLDAAHDGVRVVMSQVTSSAVGAASLVWHGLRQAAN